MAIALWSWVLLSNFREDEYIRCNLSESINIYESLREMLQNLFIQSDAVLDHSKEVDVETFRAAAAQV